MRDMLLITFGFALGSLEGLGVISRWFFACVAFASLVGWLLW